MFAQNTATGGPSPANPFASLSGHNPFAPKPAATEDTTKSAETQPFKPLFGAVATSKPAEAKSQPAVSNLFTPKPASDGATSNPFANLSGQTPASSNIFAPKTTTDQTPATAAEAAKPFGGLFGSSTTPKTVEPANNMFAPKPVTEAPEARNPFASLATPKATGAEEGAGKAAEAQPFSIFGTPATSKAADTGNKPAASPAFGNMFATPKPAGEKEPPKTSADPQPFKSLFGTPAVSKTTETGETSSATPAFGDKFATRKPAAEDTATKPLFAAPATSKPTEAEKAQTPAPAKAAPFGSLFGASPGPAKSGEGQTAPPPSNLFANSGQAPVSSPFGKTAEEPPASLFGASTGSNLAGKSAKASETNTIVNPFQSPFSKPQATTSIDKEGATPDTTTRALSSQAPSTNEKDHLPLSSSSSLPPSSSFTPPVYPYDIANTRSAQEADNLFRQSSNPASIETSEMPLKPLFPANKPGANPAAVTQYQKLVYLTESFKRLIAKCDPEKHDIDEIIILYAELRRQIGIPLGSIDPDEEEKRNNIINAAEAVEESRSTGEPIAAAKPPPTFHPLSTLPSKNATAKPSPGASDTLNKFKQSFSSSSGPPASVTSSTPTAAPVPNAIATPAVIAVESSKASPAAPASAIPNFGKDTTGPASSAPTPAFAKPKFGNGTGATDFMAQFKAQAEKTAAAEKAKRKAEEFDSEEDDEEEWERRDAELQREKRAKYETAASKRSVFVPGQGFKFVENEAATTSEPAPPKSTELFPLKKAASLDPPVEPTSSASAPSTSLFGVNGSSSLPPASKPLFGAKPPATSTSMFASSSTPSSTSSVFGSTQPVPSSHNIFGALASTSPKRKSSADESDDESPAKKNKASPPASSATGLFGRVSNPATPALTPPATSLSDASVSAATGPGVSTETASTAVAATEDGEGEPGEIFNLTNSNPGEEDETVVFEQRAKAFELQEANFVSLGVGLLRILKHPGTSRTRMVLRADPSGNVILNTLLKKEFQYTKNRNSVQFDGVTLDGKLTRFAMKVKESTLDNFFEKINESKY